MEYFSIIRDIVQTNKYTFIVKADNSDEAISKLNDYLVDHSPVLEPDEQIIGIDKETDV